MSLDVWLVEPPSEEKTVYEWLGMTSNMGPMAEWAGIGTALWYPERIGAERAWQLIGPLEAGLQKLRDDPREARKFNPENGWGNYEGFLEFVESYLAACKKNPGAYVRVHS